MKHSQLRPRQVPAIFQIEADSTYYQVAGNIVGQLVRIMPTNGFRYKLGLFISRSKSMYIESKIQDCFSSTPCSIGKQSLNARLDLLKINMQTNFPHSILTP